MCLSTTTISITPRVPRFVCARRLVKSSRRQHRQGSCFSLDSTVRDLRPGQKSPRDYESRLPGSLARLKRWLVMHHMTLMTIADTPHSIALGSAIGIFFGFTPLYPLKTLLSIAVAWVCRCNKIAAAIAVTVHDVAIWAMPALYLAEYQFGCWILNRPVAQRVHFRQFRLHDYVHWHVFSRVVWPTFWPAFVGSLFVAIPSAVFIYVLMRLLISRARIPQKSD